MVKNKKLSIEDLIAVAKKPLKEKPKKQNGSMIEKFIQEERLSTGTIKINLALVYDRYYKWCDINHTIPVTIREFSKELKFFFPKVVRKEGTFYIMSLEGFNMSLENEAILKEKYKLGKGSSGARKKKKEKQKGHTKEDQNIASEIKEKSQT